MKTRTAIVALIIIALGAGVWTLWQNASGGASCLVPAWQLTARQGNDASSCADPFASWSPDSRSLLFSACSTKSYREFIYRWKVGEKRLERITEGSTPNYLDSNGFLFLRKNPRTVFQYSFDTRTGREIIPDIKKMDFWKDCTGLCYDPKRKTVKVGFASLARFYEPGCKEYDMAGKRVSDARRSTGNGILAISSDPKGDRVAVILGDVAIGDRMLKVSRKGEETAGTTIGTGDYGDAAWSPDGKVIAFAEQAQVRVMRPNDLKPVTVARFGEAAGNQNDPFVCRLLWSPDSSYLAVLELVPEEASTYPMVYVLDMTKLKW